MLAVAAIPALIQALLAIPSIALVVALFEGMFRVFGDFSDFATDPRALQAEMEAAMRPSRDLTVLAGVAGGISYMVLIFAWAGLTSAAIAAAEGRPVSISLAYREVFARRAGIVIPAIVFGAIWAALSAAQAFFQPSSGGLITPDQTVFYSLIGLLFLGASIGAFVLLVVWSLGLPAILVEGLDLRRGLARGAELTRGIRFSLGLAFVAVFILEGLVVSILASIIAVTGGAVAESVEVGVVLYFATVLTASVLWLPLIPAILAVAYRERTTGEGPTGDTGPPDVEAAPGDDGAASLIEGG